MTDMQTQIEYSLDCITKAELALQMLGQEYASLESEIARLKTDRNYAYGEIERLKSELAVALRERNEYFRQCGYLQTDVADARADLHSITEDLAQALRHLKRAFNDEGRYNEEVDDLIRKHKELP